MFPGVFTFYSHTKHITQGEVWASAFNIDCRIFSNLYPCQVVIDGETYSSTETYFQQYKYPTGDQNFIKQLSNMSDVASYGQRRLVLRKKHIDAIEQLKKEGKEYPNKQDGTEYQVKDKSNPKLQISDWDTRKVKNITKT